MSEQDVQVKPIAITAVNPGANTEQSTKDPWELFLIIHHPRSAQILLCTHSTRCQLPCFVTQPRARAFFFGDTAEWLPELQQYFGLTFDVTLLRCIWHNRYNKDEYDNSDIVCAIIVLESHGGTVEAPVGTEWMDPSCISWPKSALHEAKSTIEQFAEECRTGIQPTFRPLFARRGWYQNAVEWMKRQLSSKGFEAIDEVTQIKCTYRGTVLKVKTSRGVVYLKCSPQFINEALICKQLASMIRKFVAAPLATDIERRLLLMGDYGEMISVLHFDDCESTQWANELAEIHQSTVAKKQILLDAGLRCLTFGVIEAELDNVLTHAEQMQFESIEAIKLLRRFSEEIRRDCRAVEGLRIPSTFVHGDLYFSNVYRCHGAEASHGMIDFGEATVSHPFVDILACRDRPAYSDKWITFLKIKFPRVAHGLSKEKLLECQVLCIKLSPLWEAVRLYQEMDTVESPVPPEMLLSFHMELKALLRNYKPATFMRQRKRNLIK